jgi:VIT1/CCC1 family predicted Fe2+/Mn2+ transporter
MPPLDRSVAQVLQDIVHNIQDIVRAEVRLAKTEVREEVVKAKTAGVFIGAGAVSVLFSALFLLFAIVYGLSHVVADWAAALIVALALAIVAGVLLSLGVGRFSRVHPIPDQTVGSIKENMKWAKQQTK